MDPPSITITPSSLSDPHVLALLQSHIISLTTINTLNNQLGHLLSLSALHHPSITIFTARLTNTNELLGCAALQELSHVHGELKSMRTVPEHRRKGVARELVRWLVGVARERGYERVSLETGVQGEFEGARKLYVAEGFGVCKPYEGYVDGEVEGSVFMTRVLE